MNAIKSYWGQLPIVGRWMLSFLLLVGFALLFRILPNRASIEASALPVTVAELEAAYDGNEVSAQQKYGGRLLAITGKVAKVALNSDDDPFVSFESSGLMPFQASFNKQNGAATAQLLVGQEVTVYCNEVTETLGQPYASNCAL